jgi:hypothetical protein
MVLIIVGRALTLRIMDEGSDQEQTLFAENYFLKKQYNKNSSGNDRDKAFRSKLLEKNVHFGQLKAKW